MEKVKVAQGVADQLFATEAAIDAAIAEASRLMQTMVEARQDLNLSATTGNAALARIAGGLAELTEARTRVVEAHGELNDLRLRMGMRTSMVGIFDKPEETGSTSRAQLRSVG